MLFTGAASGGQFAPPYYPAELLKPQQPQPQYVQAFNAQGERVMVLLQQPQPQARPLQPQLQQPIQLPLGAGGGLTLAQLQQLQLQQQQQQQQAQLQAQLRAPQLVPAAPQARGLAPAAPAHHAAQPQQLYILTSAGLQSVGGSGGGATSLPLHAATHAGLPPRPQPAAHHHLGGQPILLPAQSGAPPQLRPAGQPVQLAASLPAGAQYLNLAPQHHLQPNLSPLQLGGARLGGGAAGGGAGGGTGALLHTASSLPFSSGLTTPQVLPLSSGQAAHRQHPGHPLQLHQLLQARSNPPRSSPVPAQQPQVVQPQPPPHTDLMLLLQRQQQQQQQQQIASLQARVATLNSQGQQPQQRAVTSLPLTSSALLAGGHGGASAGLPVHSGGLLVSSAGLLASLLQPLRAQQQHQHAPPGSADQQRIDQSLFLAQLVAQQQQQQQRLGRSPRSSTGTPPLALQSAAMQNHRADLPHLPLEEEDHIVFSEQRRPAPRNMSAPALPHAAAGNRQLPQNLNAPGGLQPQQQLLELKSASSDTNLQNHVNGSEAGKGAPGAASNTLHDPAAAAAAAATAALAQPINHTNNSKSPVGTPPAATAELGGDASKAADGGLGNLSSILLSIGVELARHGISVETAVGAGWLGVLSPADVRLLHDAYTSEVQRLQVLHAPPTANGNTAVAADGAAQGAPDTWSQGVQRLSHAGAPHASGALSLHQSQLLHLLQPHVADVHEGAGVEQLSAVVEHVCREQGVARGSMDAALATLGADAQRDANGSPAPKPLAEIQQASQLAHAKENGIEGAPAATAAAAAASADANGGAGVGKEGTAAAGGDGGDAGTASAQQQQQEREQSETRGQKEREQADLQQQLDAGKAERAQLEQQLLAASPAQFSAFEYGFFAPPDGAGGTELMECLEDLNQGIFDATGLGDNKGQEGEQNTLKTQDEEPLTQLPNTARDSDEEGPSNHELAARFASLDLGSGFF